MHSMQTMQSPGAFFMYLMAALLLAGVLWLLWRYQRDRFSGQEDRFMALYSREDWDACNMDILFEFDPAVDAAVKAAFRSRLQALIEAVDPASSLLHEVGEVSAAGIQLRSDPDVDATALCSGRRQGLHFDLSVPGVIRVIWNHVQTDGVGLWETLRGAFDPSPPLVAYDGARVPPPLLPEVLALPLLMRRLAWRGTLADQVGPEATRRVQSWPAEEIRTARARWDANFNLVSAAALLKHVFDRHPQTATLCVGILVFFPFIRGRNRYGVLQAKLRRGDIESLVRQLQAQTRFPLLRWGVVATQQFLLGQLPERAFEPVMRHYRRQIDVLISNLPVGTTPACIEGHRIRISCHPWELATPYYLLLVGTRDELTLSVSSRFTEAEDFMATPGLSETQAPSAAPRTVRAREAA